MKTIKPYVFSLATLTLAACGGGGSDKHSPLEGVFTGSLSNGAQVTSVILDDGTFWAIYGKPYNNGDTQILGFSKGYSSSTKDNKFTLSFTNFDYPGNNISSGTGSGTYTSSSAAVSITQDSQTVTFNVNAPPSQYYVYKQPASLAAITGTWLGQLLDGDEATININADGIFSGASEGNCSFNGKFTPRPHDVNVFNISLTFGGAPCPYPGQSASGIGVNALREDGKNQLFTAVTTPGMNFGSVFYALR